MRHRSEVEYNGASSPSSSGILIILVMSPWSSMVSPEADETQRLDDERDVEFFPSEPMLTPILSEPMHHQIYKKSV